MKQFLFTLFLFFGILVAYAGGNGNVIQHGGENPVIAQPKTANPKWVDKVLENRVVKRVLKMLEDIAGAERIARQSQTFGIFSSLLYVLNILISIAGAGAGIPAFIPSLISLTALILSVCAIISGVTALSRYRKQESQIGIGSAIFGLGIGIFWVGLTLLGILIILKLLGII